MTKKKGSLTLNNTQINESSLLTRISKIIEKRKYRAEMYANREVTIMYWEIGRYIGSVLLGGERAEYGKKILATLSQQLRWSHFIELLSLEWQERLESGKSLPRSKAQKQLDYFYDSKDTGKDVYELN